MSSKKELTCKNCGISFMKELKEYNRQLKRGRESDHFFCSLSCTKTWNNINNPIQYKETEKTLKHLSKMRVLAAEKNKKGNFTYYLNKTKQRKHEFNLTEKYLQEIWDSQNGKCVFTGYNMPLQTYNKKVNLYSASLDRIDSSKGYVEGNVQFVCFFINLGKRNFSDNDVHEFIKHIALQQDS